MDNNIIEINLKGKSDSLAYKKLLRPYSSLILFGLRVCRGKPKILVLCGLLCTAPFRALHDEPRQNVASLLWPWPREANMGQAHCPDPLNERGEEPLLSPPAGMSEADRPGSSSCREQLMQGLP